MVEKIKITWEVEDGYIGGSRPHYTYIDKGDLDECEGVDEQDALIEQCVKEDYEQNITFIIQKVEGE